MCTCCRHIHDSRCKVASHIFIHSYLGVERARHIKDLLFSSIGNFALTRRERICRASHTIHFIMCSTGSLRAGMLMQGGPPKEKEQKENNEVIVLCVL